MIVSRLYRAALLLAALLFPSIATAQTPGKFLSDSKTGCKFWWPRDMIGEIVSFHWSGACAKGLAAGRGSFEATEEHRVRGAHLDGSETVTAHRTTWNGEGETSGGKLQGRAFIAASFGYRVEGEYRDGVLNGRGFFTQDNETEKSRYEGEFRNGKQEGTGVYDAQQFLRTDKPPLVVHEQGEWANGQQIKGLLTMRTAGCSAEYRYEGEMTNGKFNGRGTLKAADGKVYTGVWNMGHINVGGREISDWDIATVMKVCWK